MRQLADHGLPLVQLKEQRRDLIVALQNRNGPVSGWELMQIAAVRRTDRVRPGYGWASVNKPTTGMAARPMPPGFGRSNAFVAYTWCPNHEMMGHRQRCTCQSSR